MKLLLTLPLTLAIAVAQPITVRLTSGETAPGKPIKLKMNITSPKKPVGLSWIFKYPDGVESFTVEPGETLKTSEKQLQCRTDKYTTCVVAGMNSTSIQNGTIAVLTITPDGSRDKIPVEISQMTAASGDANPVAMPVNAQGGMITVKKKKH